MTRILVLHVPNGGGHRAAAHAIAEAAAEHAGATGETVEVDVIDALEHTPRWWRRAYTRSFLRTTAHAPAAYGLTYDTLNQRSPLVDGVRRGLDRTVGRALRAFAQSDAYDVVVGTHYFPLAVLGRDRARGALGIPLVAVVTDYAAHAFWAEPGVDLYCAPRGGAGLDLERHGAAASIIAPIGIPVRPAFGRIAPLAPHAGPVRVLLTSGGFGIGPLAAALRSFAGVPAELVVVCGNAPERVEEARRIAAELGLSAEVVGFEKDMPRRMAWADVVVSKPGGLTVSECLAAGRPFVSMGACPGQEQHNEDWLVVNRAAVAVPAARVGAAVAELDPTTLVAMAAAARRIGAPHAAREVVRRALRLAREAATLRALAA
ncbi:MAG: hypothetical protein HY908_33285 [Myxococcales bacterium]|nr:hypothetical protein [Myxococcales bacterium]